MTTQAINNLGTIGVLMGGYSSERDISLKSGRAVIESLTKAGCSVVPLDINVRERDRIKDAIQKANVRIGFIALHGALGEDGTIQSILEELDIPYTGSGVDASVRAFNKIQTQRILQANGLPVPHFCVAKAGSVDIEEIARTLKIFPLVVKPACEGSSIGVTVARQKEDLSVALAGAFRYGNEVIVERFIPGRELTVGILDREALPIVEIRPQTKFFDFEAKYQKGMTEYIVPAPLSADLTRNIQAIALKAHQAVGCEVFSRIDVRLNPEDKPFILEINTIPGFTETSLFPKAARQAGMEFTDVCLRLVQLAYGKKKIDIPTVYIRNSIIVFFLLFVALAVYRNCVDFLKTSPLFRIKDVTASADVQFLQPRVLRQIQGQNIFAADLKRVHNDIRAVYPQIYNLHVERRFPDTIHVVAQKREAYAQVLVKQNYLTIDNNGIVIFADKKPLPPLILIKNGKLDKYKIYLGTQLNTPEMAAGLDTIQAFKSNPGLSKYPISDIDVDNLSKIVFSIGPELQIIIDRDDIAKKLDTLAFLIAQKKLNFLEVKYIDLRFKEPIVGKK